MKKTPDSKKSCLQNVKKHPKLTKNQTRLKLKRTTWVERNLQMLKKKKLQKLKRRKTLDEKKSQQFEKSENMKKSPALKKNAKNYKKKTAIIKKSRINICSNSILSLSQKREWRQIFNGKDLKNIQVSKNRQIRKNYYNLKITPNGKNLKIWLKILKIQQKKNVRCKKICKKLKKNAKN